MPSIRPSRCHLEYHLQNLGKNSFDKARDTLYSGNDPTDSCPFASAKRMLHKGSARAKCLSRVKFVSFRHKYFCCWSCCWSCCCCCCFCCCFCCMYIPSRTSMGARRAPIELHNKFLADKCFWTKKNRQKHFAIEMFFDRNFFWTNISSDPQKNLGRQFLGQTKNWPKTLLAEKLFD